MCNIQLNALLAKRIFSHFATNFTVNGLNWSGVEDNFTRQ